MEAQATEGRGILKCSQFLSEVMKKLERELDRAESAEIPSPKDCFNKTLANSWESDLIETALVHGIESHGGQWALVRLADPVSGLLRLRSTRGLTRNVAFPTRVREEPLEIETECASSARVVCVEDLAHQTRYRSLAALFPNTGSLAAIPLLDENGDTKGVLVFGFAPPRGRLSVETIRSLEKEARSFATALRVHRRIHETAAASLAGATPGDAKAIVHPTPPPLRQSVPLPVSIARHPETIDLSSSGYCSAATTGTGASRLFAAPLKGKGFERHWDALALEAIFDLACARRMAPADVVELARRLLAAEECGRTPAERAVACADVADSGREYVLAGNMPYLLYENRTQMITEHFPARRGPAETTGVPQPAPLRSGDILILVTSDLPADLAERHSLYRRLAALLAHEVRRPAELIASRIAELLRSSAPQSAEPTLILLRSE